jgi:hypothetical protein
MGFVRLRLVALLAIAAISCSESAVDPLVTFSEQSCSSSSVDGWPSSGPIEIEVSNNSEVVTAVVIGTYLNGFGHADLIAYGSNVSTRPEFIEALDIHRTGPGVTNTLRFDHGPGTFFMVCMPDTNTMIVLDDLVVDS